MLESHDSTGDMSWTAVNIGKVPVSPTKVRYPTSSLHLQSSPNTCSSKFQEIASKRYSMQVPIRSLLEACIQSLVEVKHARL